MSATTFSAADVVKLRASAMRFGLSLADVSAVLTKWGPPVLKLLIEGLRQGLTFNFMKEVLDTLGPLFLSQAVAGHAEKNFKARGVARSVLPPQQQQITCVCTCKCCCCPEQQCDVEEQSAFTAKAAPIIQAEQVDKFEADKGLAELLIQILTAMFDKVGPQLLQWLLPILLELLKDQTKKAQLVAILKESLDA